jgi:hypothetical protein
MRLHTIKLAATLAFGVLAMVAVPPASAQGRQGMEGAGGSGGAGGGAAVPRGPVREGAYGNRNSPYAQHVRTTTPPPMDPSRRIYEVDCTQPFDSLGKGNLRCR